ncbi:MAG: S8 family serine peptidase [Methanosarcinaceae archaeon]|nr:S8 family serine peptidase [Methanosarcinaceae archaeon]
MNKRILSIFASFLILLSITVVPAIAATSGNEKVSVIISFKDKPDAALVKAHGGDVKQQYTIIPAISADVPAKALYGLSHNSKIDIIELDAKVQAMGQVTPWGIERIQAPAVHRNGIYGTGIKVAIIDTGVDYNHPDLAANYIGGYDFVNSDEDPMDDAGHGTHVAGTVAAINNDIGVIGAAPGIDLYALKVLNSEGSGSYSNIISAIQWAVDNNMDVASMSLGGSSNLISLSRACDNAYRSGLVIVAAAGNDAGRVSYPAAYSSVIAVAATDYNDTRAWFSNYGSQIELSAPGVGINSTILGGGYSGNTWSGTSMATPHVTGAVALLLTTSVPEVYDTNSNNVWDPAEVRQRFQDTAIDLGAAGKDNYYGYGLINASAAVEFTSQEPPVEDGVMHIGNITMDTASKTSGKKTFTRALATVEIVDVNGGPVQNAQVSGSWSDSTSDRDIGITDINGAVTLQSNNIKGSSGTFTFTVTGVTLASWTYNTTANVYISNSITV